MMQEQKQETLERRERLNQQGEEFLKRFVYQPGKRHKLVKGLKIVLPSIIVIYVLVSFIVPYIKASFEEDLAFDSLEITPVGNIEMINPIYNAYDEDKNPYNIVAKKARRDMDQPSLLELHEPRAQFETLNKERFDLDARLGQYEQDKGMLDLEGSVLLYETEGYALKSERLSIDLNKGIAVSPTPVEGSGPHGNISSEGLMIDKNQNKVVFEGKTKITLY